MIQKSDSLSPSPSGSFDTDNLPNSNAGAIIPYDPMIDTKGSTRRKSFSRRVDELLAIDSFPEPTQAGELFSATVRGRRPPPVSYFAFLSCRISCSSYLVYLGLGSWLLCSISVEDLLTT